MPRAEDSDRMRPLLLLDVDGVLNALGRPVEDGYVLGSAVAAGRTWPICYSPEVIAHVLRWLDEGVDVQWLTTWGEEANAGLHELLGLPQLPVAGTFGDGEEESWTAPSVSLAEITPAAPDQLTGRWWKFDVARAAVRAQPDRPVVWVDDDLDVETDVQDWMRAHCRCLLVVPNPGLGLTGSDLGGIDDFLRSS